MLPLQSFSIPALLGRPRLQPSLTRARKDSAVSLKKGMAVPVGCATRRFPQSAAWNGNGVLTLTSRSMRRGGRAARGSDLAALVPGQGADDDGEIPLAQHLRRRIRSTV